jgi:hypothetical protein
MPASLSFVQPMLPGLAAGQNLSDRKMMAVRQPSRIRRANLAGRGTEFPANREIFPRANARSVPTDCKRSQIWHRAARSREFSAEKQPQVASSSEFLPRPFVDLQLQSVSSKTLFSQMFLFCFLATRFQ